LHQQILPFKPTFTLGERVEGIEKTEAGNFVITTSDQTIINAKVIVIAGGLGCFEPRKPEVDKLEHFEGKGVVYMVKDPEKFRNKKLVIAGGGDSALDWSIFLSEIAAEVTLVHRNESFRGAPDSTEKVFHLAKEGRLNLLLNSNLHALDGNGVLKSVDVINKQGIVNRIETDYMIPLFGLSPKLGPIGSWGLQVDKSAIEVNTLDYATNIEGIYAIGDINTYPGKLKLILCGFHEAAMMAQSAFKYVYPKQKLSFKYTTVNGVNAF
jgi:thioredoxin reductase (NADPH)